MTNPQCASAPPGGALKVAHSARQCATRYIPKGIYNREWRTNWARYGSHNRRTTGGLAG